MVDVKQIPDFNQLSYDAVEGLTIGAAVSCLRICNDPSVTAHYPGLIDSVKLIGGIQIQGRATLGGNLVNASPAADSIPALIALDAQCTIVGSNGVRSVPVESFCLSPGQTVLQKGAYGKDDLLNEVRDLIEAYGQTRRAAESKDDGVKDNA